MACRGVHFALTDEEVSKLRSFDNDSERLDWLHQEVEDRYFTEFPHFKAESDKAWDAMHRVLSNGELSYTDGSEPLRFAVMGGEPLYSGADYIISLKTPEQVKAVSEALSAISQDDFQMRYDAMDAEQYGHEKSEDDFEYTWQWFLEVVSLFRAAALQGRYVLFTVDQ